jgi:hypothetical protein
MTERVRVYHPETDEPFDVPKSKADELRLNKGWRSHPLDPTAVPAVTETERGSTADSAPELEDWRDSEIGEEVVAYDEPVQDRAKARNRK